MTGHLVASGDSTTISEPGAAGSWRQLELVTVALANRKTFTGKLNSQSSDDDGYVLMIVLCVTAS